MRIEGSSSRHPHLLGEEGEILEEEEEPLPVLQAPEEEEEEVRCRVKQPMSWYPVFWYSNDLLMLCVNSPCAYISCNVFSQLHGQSLKVR